VGPSGIANNDIVGTNVNKVAKASLNAYHCPSRRSADVSNGGSSAGMAGPTADYAVVMWYASNGDGTQQGTGNQCCWWDLHGRGLDQNCFSAIRTATVVDPATSNRVFTGFGGITNGWAPRDSFAKLTDGTSNVILIGEKFLNQPEIGKCCGGNNNADGNIYYQQNNWGEYTVGRHVRTNFPLLARNQQQDNPDNQTAFGSWHDGIAQFLLADGSVRAISNNVDVNLFRNLCHVSDGNVIGDY